jgi:hypothetical protein
MNDISAVSIEVRAQAVFRYYDCLTDEYKETVFDLQIERGADAHRDVLGLGPIKLCCPHISEHKGPCPWLRFQAENHRAKRQVSSAPAAVQKKRTWASGITQWLRRW